MQKYNVLDLKAGDLVALELNMKKFTDKAQVQQASFDLRAIFLLRKGKAEDAVIVKKAQVEPTSGKGPFARHDSDASGTKFEKTAKVATATSEYVYAMHPTSRPASCTKIATTAKDAIATPGNVYGMIATHPTTRPASCTKIATTAKDAIATPGKVYGDDR
ncbi:hypothetical protein M407DRAFT_24696 [Tulasnella calospora MUT 4182]|uniref:Uncharacterized protein n=1 Tax=Tulasnella calospora MUT 4182 TaxID=1051891 RepID=A0A0C3KWX5_9AGAM|nr:hypothetical protein M407DRAFT_24696 [Tulasnella calospora MUT 4182]